MGGASRTCYRRTCICPIIAALGLSFFSHANGEYTFVGLGTFRSIVGAEGFGVFQPLSFYLHLQLPCLDTREHRLYTLELVWARHCYSTAKVYG